MDCERRRRKTRQCRDAERTRRATWTIDRSRGSRDVLKEHPNLKILAERWADEDRSIQTKIMENLLQTFPKIDYVIGVAFPDTAGAADAIRAAGREGKVKIAASSLDQALVPFMREGQFTMPSPST